MNKDADPCLGLTPPDPAPAALGLETFAKPSLLLLLPNPRGDKAEEEDDDGDGATSTSVIFLKRGEPTTYSSINLWNKKFVVNFSPPAKVISTIL